MHDPQALVVSRDEVPRLLKSLRCELVTFIAANNQKNMLFAAEAKVDSLKSAAEKYQYSEIDPRRFGTVSLSLQIQDNLGLQSGTQFDWFKTNDGGAHARLLNIGPTGSDQSTYSATWNFIFPQDAITFHAHHPDGSSKEMAPRCYAEIPKRIPPPFGSIYAEPDLDALSRNDFPDYALFKRVLVNNSLPLAAWRQQVGSSITETTLDWHDVRQKPSHHPSANELHLYNSG